MRSECSRVVCLFFRHRHHPAADPSTPPILGQEEPGDVDEPEFGLSVEPANDPTGLRIADEYRERAKVVVSGLVQIVGAETVADYRCVCGIKPLDGSVSSDKDPPSIGLACRGNTGRRRGLSRRLKSASLPPLPETGKVGLCGCSLGTSDRGAVPGCPELPRR